MKHRPWVIDCISNSSVYCLINSVDFHPSENWFCATFSGRNMLVIYKINPQGRVCVSQKIIGSNEILDAPQHAIFSTDGKKIIVSNWISESFTIYSQLPDGLYSSKPIIEINFPEKLCGYKPHGLAINSTGNLIACAFGASSKQPKAVATFRFYPLENRMRLSGLLVGNCLPGIPKGICFTPDDSQLIVTFSDVNSINIYPVDSKTGSIEEVASQTYQGPDTGLDRPEDVKISHLKNQIIVSNSGKDLITFYKFDMVTNRIIEPQPEHTLGQQRLCLAFPHGLAVSPDGRFLVASQFGQLEKTLDEDIIFGQQTPTRQSKIWIFEYSISNKPSMSQRNWPWTPLARQLRDRLEKRS